MDYTAKYEEAKSHGYSDQEIAEHLGGEKYQEAVKHGYSDAEIINHFTGLNLTAQPVPKADEQGNQPVNLSPQQQIEFERSGFNKFSTNPTGQRLIDNASTVVEGMGTAQLGLGLAKGGLNLGLKGIAKASDVSGTSSVLNKLKNFVGVKLERAGETGINKLAGIKPSTVEDIARAGQNPGKVGLNLGAKLADSKAVTMDPIKTFDNASVELKKAGESVGKAWENIAKSNGNGGKQMMLQADDALKPLKESIDEIKSDPIKATRNSVNHIEELYKDLKARASESDGFLYLEDIHKSLKSMGKRLGKGSEEAQNLMAESYGQLANVRDHMVGKLAEAVGDPALKANLLKSNSEFSQWIRLLPDLKKAATKESVGAGANHGFFTNMWDAISYPLRTPAAKAKMIEVGKAMQEAPKPRGFSIASNASSNKRELDRALSILKNERGVISPFPDVRQDRDIPGFLAGRPKGLIGLPKRTADTKAFHINIKSPHNETYSISVNTKTLEEALAVAQKAYPKYKVQPGLWSWIDGHVTKEGQIAKRLKNAR